MIKPLALIFLHRQLNFQLLINQEGQKSVSIFTIKVNFELISRKHIAKSARPKILYLDFYYQIFISYRET